MISSLTLAEGSVWKIGGNSEGDVAQRLLIETNWGFIYGSWKSAGQSKLLVRSKLRHSLIFQSTSHLNRYSGILLGMWYIIYTYTSNIKYFRLPVWSITKEKCQRFLLVTNYVNTFQCWQCFFFNYSIVNGHAPKEISDAEEKEGFFDALETAYDISQRNYIKIVLGDFNVQVGKEAVNFPTIGNYSLHNLMNDNGSQQIQFAVSRNMIIGSTLHPHKDIHKIIWMSPDGVTFNQIDHF